MRFVQNDIQGLGGVDEGPVALLAPVLLWRTVLFRVSILVIEHHDNVEMACFCLHFQIIVHH